MLEANKISNNNSHVMTCWLINLTYIFILEGKPNNHIYDWIMKLFGEIKSFSIWMDCAIVKQYKLSYLFWTILVVRSELKHFSIIWVHYQLKHRLFGNKGVLVFSFVSKKTLILRYIHSCSFNISLNSIESTNQTTFWIDFLYIYCLSNDLMHW